MKNIKTVNDEIDLFELSLVLWARKKLICIFILISVVFGSSFILISVPTYETNLNYSVDNIPPFYLAEQATSHFKKTFFSKKAFIAFKLKEPSSKLIFDDFKETYMFEGVLLRKPDKARLVLYTSTRGDKRIIIKSAQLQLVNDYFIYANYINSILRMEYLKRAKDELKIIKTRFTDFSNVNEVIIEQLLIIDRYIVAAEKGAHVLLFERPDMPKKVSPNSPLIIVLSIILGGIIGMTIAIIQNSNRKRKDDVL